MSTISPSKAPFLGTRALRGPRPPARGRVPWRGRSGCASRSSPSRSGAGGRPPRSPKLPSAPKGPRPTGARSRSSPEKASPLGTPWPPRLRAAGCRAPSRRFEPLEATILPAVQVPRDARLAASGVGGDALDALPPAREAQNLGAQAHLAPQVGVLFDLSQSSVLFRFQSDVSWRRHIAIISWRYLSPGPTSTRNLLAA